MPKNWLGSLGQLKAHILRVISFYFSKFQKFLSLPSYTDLPFLLYHSSSPSYKLSSSDFLLAFFFAALFNAQYTHICNGHSVTTIQPNMFQQQLWSAVQRFMDSFQTFWSCLWLITNLFSFLHRKPVTNPSKPLYLPTQQQYTSRRVERLGIFNLFNSTCGYFGWTFGGCTPTR